MATTPNFNWSTPDNTGLVKNGALDIRTLGNAIDASMADLKGGTTGQVLSKASNTDMDFVWAADAGAPTSLGFAAGKNKIINGDFGIWQRGTSFTHSGTAYTADRFQGYSDASQTYSRQTFTPATAPVAGYEGQYFWRGVKSASGSFISLIQPIEDVRSFAGQTMTVSFWTKTDAAQTVYVRPYQNFGSGGSSTVVLTSQSISSTTSWARYTLTFTVPSISGKTVGTGSFFAIETFIAPASTVTWDVWGVQVEAGSTATAFQTATGTIQGELIACMRYFYVIASGDQQSITNGFYSSSTDCRGNLRYPVQMRITPTLLSSVGTDHFAFETSAGVDGLNRLDGARVSNTSLLIYNNTTASGIAGNAGELRTNNASASLTASAEL